MAKAPGEASKRKARAKDAPPVETRRDDHLEALLTYCVAAKKIADEKNEKFLAYMLAMTIEEARLNLGRRMPG